MDKTQIIIEGYEITKLSENTFEAQNKNENLDFYFEINEEDEIDVFVFDSLKDNSDEDAFIYSFTEQNLQDAVIVAMEYSI